ncbi:MAG: glycosyltransferase family 9 protein [Algoriella sp.]
MIGDVLITSLLCENLKKAYPNATIDYLVNSNTLPVLENNPYIDNKIIFDEKEDKGLLKLIQFSKQVNQNKYDVVIDAYSKLQSWVDVWINNAPKKISYKKSGRTFLYTDNVIKHDKPNSVLGLAIEHRLELLKPLGISTPFATEPKLYLTEIEIQSAKDLFKKYKVDSSRKTVMISLLGSDLSKTYPLNQMAKLILLVIIIMLIFCLIIFRNNYRKPKKFTINYQIRQNQRFISNYWAMICVNL